MRADAMILVECDHCHTVIEVPLVKASWQSVWTGYEINGYLMRHGWVVDATEGNDYCGATCHKAGTKGKSNDPAS